MKYVTAKLNKTNFTSLGSRMFLGLGLVFLLGTVTGCDPDDLRAAQEVMTTVQDAAEREARTQREEAESEQRMQIQQERQQMSKERHQMLKQKISQAGTKPQMRKQKISQAGTKQQMRKKAQMGKRKKVMRSKCGLKNLKAGRKFIAEAWALPDSKFNFGEPLTFQMRVSSPTYMSIFHVSASCKVTRLMDNMPMQAAEIVNFPLRDSGMRMIAKPPAGREAFYLIATREKLEFLAGADILSTGAGGTARLDLNPQQFFQRVKQFRDRINPDDLSMRTLPISKMTSAPKKIKRAGCNLQLLSGSRTFIAEAWAVPDNKFNFGEPLNFQMRVSSPTYMSVYHVSTSCQVTRLLDNMPMKASEIVDFPLKDSGMRVTVKPPAGREAFYLIATREKLEFLASADILSSAGGGVASLYLTPEQFYERVKQFRDRINPSDLSMRTLIISIVGN